MVFEGNNIFSENNDGGIASYNRTVLFNGVNQLLTTQPQMVEESQPLAAPSTAVETQVLSTIQLSNLVGLVVEFT